MDLQGLQKNIYVIARGSLIEYISIPDLVKDELIINKE